MPCLTKPIETKKVLAIFSTMNAKNYLSTEEKKTLFSTHSPKKEATDTGSVESQVALFSRRITHLTKHLKKHKKDYATRLNLLRMVGKRRRLLNYLNRKEVTRYRALLEVLSLRK